MRNGVKNPRGQKHVAPVVDYVRHCGGDNVQVTQTSRLHVDWLFNGQRMAIALPAAPKDVDEAAMRGKQAVRRRYREHDVEVRA